MHVLYNPTLVVQREVVLFSGGEKMDPIRGGKDTMRALSAETGEVLWTAPHPPSGYASAEDLFVVDGLVWCGATTNRNDTGVFTGRDILTGTVKREFAPDDWPHMPHHRCHRAKATRNYILTSRTGIEFVDIRNEHWDANHWVRGSCNYGIMPANGLIYAPPHSCACYLLAKLNGFNALASASAQDVTGLTATERHRAAAVDAPLEAPAPAGDWPTYRHDAARTGSVPTSVSPSLKRRWTASVGGRLSSLTAAAGQVYVASTDRHTVSAIDAESGELLWRFAAGARVDSPPTCWRGRVVFGSADGWIYCLRAADGVVVWRFHGAPAERWRPAYEQLESVWPLHGSVLIHDGVVYCVAGRSMWLDGGMRFLRLDARTGALIGETVLDDHYPGSSDSLQRDVKWPNLPVALPDILSFDGTHIHMRSQAFTLAGDRPEVTTPRAYDDQTGAGSHLFSPTGFLDDAWWHRSYWMYGKSYISAAGGWYLATYQAPAGRILAIDGDTVYGYGRVPLRFTGTQNTYHFFSCPTTPELINPQPNRPPRKRGESIYGKVYATRLKYHWSHAMPVMVRGLCVTSNAVFAAGPTAQADEEQVYLTYGEPKTQEAMRRHVAAVEGKSGGVLVVVTRDAGTKTAAYALAAPPVFDGLIAASGRVFLATTAGTVVCLAEDGGTTLEEAEGIVFSPLAAPLVKRAFSVTASHPEFGIVDKLNVSKSQLGYRLWAEPKMFGHALKPLAAPLTKQAEFKVTMRSTPGVGRKDQPGNAFLVFGDGPEVGKLISCGFRISGPSFFIHEGSSRKEDSVSANAPLQSDTDQELRVTVDLTAGEVAATMLGQTITRRLATPLKQITWVGYAVSSVTSDFSPIEVSGE